MRIKRKTKSSTTPIDQFLTKDAKQEADAIPSTSGGSADVNSKVKELNGSNKTEEVPKQINKENKKITKKVTEKALEDETPAMKKLQIQLKRCDDGNEEEEVSEVHAGSDADAGNGMNKDDESKQKSKTRGRRQKSNPRETSKRKNSTSDQSDDAQKSDFESGGSSNGAGQSEEIKTSRTRGKRARKNSTEGKSKKMIDIPEEAENVQSEENGDAPEKLQEAGDPEESETVPDQAQKGTKRKRGDGKQAKDKGDGDAKPSKSAKQEKDAKSKTSRDKIPDVTAIDFSNDSKSPSGKKWNFKISSWNINGIRAWIEKNGLSYLHHEKPDIICIQETKCSDDKMPEDMKEVEGYHSYWLAGDKDGYSGVGLLSKQEPIKVEYGIGISEHDNEGRVITAEYEKFYLVAAYVPNAGRKLVRLEYRMKWDKDFRAYLKKLDAEKPVILCGDLNVAHEEIDLANPKTNKKNAGFTKEEREGFSSLLEEGFTDTFRHLYPDVTNAYTFWTYMMNARAKNVGWRLDYFVVSKRFCENLCDSVIRKDVFGSDHCPVTLFLSL